MDPTIATTARMKSPVKFSKIPNQKPRVPLSKSTVNRSTVKAIPERPKGIFPAKESADDENVEKQTAPKKK